MSEPKKYKRNIGFVVHEKEIPKNPSEKFIRYQIYIVHQDGMTRTQTFEEKDKALDLRDEIKNVGDSKYESRKPVYMEIFKITINRI